MAVDAEMDTAGPWAGHGCLLRVWSAPLGLIIAPLTWALADRVGIGRRIREIEDDLEVAADKEQAYKLIGELRELNRRLRRRIPALLSVAALLCSFMLVRILLLNYEDLVITYFQQSILICRPYIEQGDETRLRSKFAQGRSKEDYVAVITELRKVAARNKLRLPDFEPW